jgi:DNA-binding MarR family transcriptional regulator
VTVYADPADGRRRIVDLTREGRALATKLIPLDEESTEDALASLNRQERATLYRLLRRLL